MTEDEICKGCGQVIDPLVCWCGTPFVDHTYEEHLFVPMRCNCYSYLPDGRKGGLKMKQNLFTIDEHGEATTQEITPEVVAELIAEMGEEQLGECLNHLKSTAKASGDNGFLSLNREIDLVNRLQKQSKYTMEWIGKFEQLDRAVTGAGFLARLKYLVTGKLNES